MKDIQPALDVLVIQMDGDVYRQEKSAHCGCVSTICEHKGIRNPLECDIDKKTKALCPVILPCKEHGDSVEGYIEHLESLIRSWMKNVDDTCIVIPCDSTEAWIIAAYDELSDAELIENPWITIISKKKSYHNIRIAGDKKRKRVYEQFVQVVCDNWEKVTELCLSARHFEENIVLLMK